MKMNFKTIIFLLITFIQISIERRSSTRIQVVGAFGTILCNGKQYNDARIKLVNHLSFRNSDVMDSIAPKKNGDFYVRGHTKGYFTIRKGPIIRDYYSVGTIDLAKKSYQSKICNKLY
uniref:Uncharacterized protein n=1 Tax=Strongyloides papillosus TaxID=174720 RepID=A0A0N5BGL6_STREA